VSGLVAIPEAPAIEVRGHILAHLTSQQRALLPWLLLPVTLGEVAERVGYWHRNSVEQYWAEIVARLNLPRGHGYTGTARLALLRLALGIDPCFCEAAA
jgi:hypothetical protein